MFLQVVHVPLGALLKAIILVCVTYDPAPSVTPPQLLILPHLPPAEERSGLPQLKAF